MADETNWQIGNAIQFTAIFRDKATGALSNPSAVKTLAIQSDGSELFRLTTPNVAILNPSTGVFQVTDKPTVGGPLKVRIYTEDAAHEGSLTRTYWIDGDVIS